MGTTFKDTSHKASEWDCAITVATIRRVHGATELNLANICEGEPSPLARLTTDAMLFADVLWHVIRPQAESRGIDKETFEGLLDGSTAERAFDAFWEAVTLFFQSRNQPATARAIRTQLQALNLGQKKMERVIGEANLEAAMEKTIGAIRERANAKAPGLFASSAPESPESTPIP